MKTIIKNSILAFMGALLVLAGCNKAPEYYSLPVPDDHMKLSASSTSLKLMRRDADNVAVTFTWNEATDRGDGEIVYYFRIYRTADKTQSSEMVKIDKGKRSIEWTTRQMNELIASWGILPGDEVQATAEVIAEVVASKVYFKPELSLCDFTISGYNPDNVMYIIIEQEVGPLRAIAMTPSSDGEGIFTWKGTMEPCSFRFSADNEAGWPAYMQDEIKENCTSIVEAESEEDAGTFFSCENESAYEITIDINEMTVTLNVIPVYRLYMVTGEIGGSERTVSLDDQQVGSDWFYWEGNLKSGQTVRFTRDDETAWPAFVPGYDCYTEPDGDAMVEVSEADGAFEVRADGLYAISILPSEGKMILRRLWWTGRMAPVGDVLADADDWNVDNYSKENLVFQRSDLKYHPHVYYLTTSFKSYGGEGFKILTTSGWNQEFVPEVNAINPLTEGWTNARQRHVSTWYSSDNDYKWHPRYDGTATIEFDVSQMKLRMVK